MGLIIYGNRNIEVTKEADRFIASDRVLQVSAEGGSVTDAIKALKNHMNKRKDKHKRNEE